MASKTKPAAKAVPVGLPMAEDTDGKKPGKFAEESAATRGIGLNDWYKQFEKGVHDYGAANNKPYLKDLAINDSASFDSAMNQIYDHEYMNNPTTQDTTGGAYSGTIRPMLSQIDKQNSASDKPFLVDRAWQPRTQTFAKAKPTRKLVPAGPLTREKVAELNAMKDYSSSTWVDPGGTKRTGEFGFDKDGNPVRYVIDESKHEYVDPDKTPYVAVDDESKVGKLFKLTSGDNTIYAVGADKRNGAGKAEVSSVAARGLGTTGSGRGLDGNPRATVEELDGSINMRKHVPDWDEVQKAGQAADKNPLKTLPSKPVAPAPAKKTTGVYMFPKPAYDARVYLGPNGLPALPKTSIHTGGGELLAERQVLLGQPRQPWGAEEDMTSDGYRVTPGTGFETVELPA